MRTEFIVHDIWPQITRAVRDSPRRCAVAVAYFGAAGSRLLPLQRGSRLVVDASERAVASGQTCPAELLKLVKRGVAVYSVPNLHAKVFVLGRVAHVGSTNVSGRSASQLVEAVIRTAEPSAVRVAREFVHDLCLHELTPTVLQRLVKLYRPPLVPGLRRGQKTPAEKSAQPALPRVLLVQLKHVDWTERDQVEHDAGLLVAKKQRRNLRTHELDSFCWSGKCPYQPGDVVIQVTNEGGGKMLVSPPGNVLHIRACQTGHRSASFVYLELPARRRRSLQAVARALGRGAVKKLRRSGLVREGAFARALLNTWAR
jgi:hypothetical protein